MRPDWNLPHRGGAHYSNRHCQVDAFLSGLAPCGLHSQRIALHDSAEQSGAIRRPQCHRIAVKGQHATLAIPKFPLPLDNAQLSVEL